MIMFVATIQLITVHMIDGREVQINPQAIIRLQTARDDADPKRQLPAAVECVIHFSDSQYLSVAETCTEVRKLIGG